MVDRRHAELMNDMKRMPTKHVKARRIDQNTIDVKIMSDPIEWK
jgi:hypothetical protein